MADIAQLRIPGNARPKLRLPVLLLPNDPRKVLPFEPRGAAARLHTAHETLVELAARTRDWRRLETAVELLMDDQQAVVHWWEENVSVNHGGDRSKNSVRSTWSVALAEEVSGIRQQQINRWKHRLKDRAAYRARLLRPLIKLAMGGKEGSDYTGDWERYTPATSVDFATEAMGSIDTDHLLPALSLKRSFRRKPSTPQRTTVSPSLGLVTFGSTRRTLIEPFVDKLLGEIQSGNVKQAIVLTDNRTDTKWFHKLVAASQRTVFTKGRLTFYNEDGPVSIQSNGSTLFYFGDRVDRFDQVFSKIGFGVTFAFPAAP